MTEIAVPENELFSGLGVGGYRSYGPDPQLLGPLMRINPIVGPNDSGKSNFLSLYHKHGASVFQAIIGQSGWSSFSASEDPHRVDNEIQPIVRVLWPTQTNAGTGRAQQLIEELLCQEIFFGSNGVAWLEFTGQVSGTPHLAPSDDYIERILRATSPELWKQLSGELTGISGGQRGEDVGRSLGWLRTSALQPLPEVSFIPAHREIRITNRPGGDDYWDLTGTGLIEHLDRLRNATYTALDMHRQYEAIRLAMQQLLEVDECNYVIPRDSSGRMTGGLELIIDGQQRPLSSFGTGYEHALLIVVATVVHPDHLFCIEEPEVHMHPRLQRRVGEFLRDQTSAQMIISTHSAALIDTLKGSVIRTSIKNHETSLTRPIDEEQIELLDELGYRPSDILQTNCVIWVEGPSDRVYLKAWMAELISSDDYVEGVHYVIMFYGGALLARLSAVASGDESEDRVPLRRIQQHFAIVADSDKSEPLAVLKERVERVADEMAERPTTHLWITAGRTIENYVSTEILDLAVQSAHPTTVSLKREDPQYGLPRAYKEDSTEITLDKVAIAEEVAKLHKPEHLDLLDLRKRLEELVDFISRSNS